MPPNDVGEEKSVSESPFATCHVPLVEVCNAGDFNLAYSDGATGLFSSGKIHLSKFGINCVG